MRPSTLWCRYSTQIIVHQYMSALWYYAYFAMVLLWVTVETRQNSGAHLPRFFPYLTGEKSMVQFRRTFGKDLSFCPLYCSYNIAVMPSNVAANLDEVIGWNVSNSAANICQTWFSWKSEFCGIAVAAGANFIGWWFIVCETWCSSRVNAARCRIRHIELYIFSSVLFNVIML